MQRTIDTRMLWLQRMLRKQYIRLQKVPTTYNSDVNTKKLLRSRRDLLMSSIGMTDDRELLKFMPPMPKVSGSVMRALVALSGLSGLPVGNSQMIEKQVDLSTDSATMWISTLVVIVVMFKIFWSMAQWNRRDRDRGDGQPVMSEQEMVARFLEEYEGVDIQDMVQKQKK